ncbi:MAG: 5'/3'-nucleotidase SurE, partial [Firmicutes bacterium]|nr:5'/3'-nucleotidase SurE [Bacillota bacterium]
MKILIVNDDGFRGKGLHALIRALKDDHDLTVVVPETEQSGKSHGITFLEPLLVTEIYLHEADFKVYAVKGTPADCVVMGIDQILGEKPDLILSGINQGYNIASCLPYSGTVSAAYEGACRGIDSIALSAAFVGADFDLVARMFKAMLPTILKEEKGQHFFYNINFPDVTLEELKGIRKTTIASEPIMDCLEKRQDPFGREYYWHSYDEVHNDTMPVDDPGSDLEAIHQGYISVTPLKLDYLDR